MRWSTIWNSLMGSEKRKISSTDLILPSFTRRPSLVTGIHSSLLSFSPRPRPRPLPRSPLPRSPPEQVIHEVDNVRYEFLVISVYNDLKVTTLNFKNLTGCTSSSSTAEASAISSSISHFIILSAGIYHMIFRISYLDDNERVANSQRIDNQINCAC